MLDDVGLTASSRHSQEDPGQCCIEPWAVHSRSRMEGLGEACGERTSLQGTVVNGRLGAQTPPDACPASCASSSLSAAPLPWQLVADSAAVPAQPGHYSPAGKPISHGELRLPHCVTSSDLLHTHLALAGTRYCYYCY